MTAIRNAVITVRKPHPCRVCNDTIEKDEKCHATTCVDEKGFFTGYFHKICYEYTADWDSNEWETMVPGSIGRKEIIEEMYSDGSFKYDHEKQAYIFRPTKN